jgi:hypothetical protein
MKNSSSGSHIVSDAQTDGETEVELNRYSAGFQMCLKRSASNWIIHAWTIRHTV